MAVDTVSATLRKILAVPVAQKPASDAPVQAGGNTPTMLGDMMTLSTTAQTLSRGSQPVSLPAPQPTYQPQVQQPTAIPPAYHTAPVSQPTNLTPPVQLPNYPSPPTNYPPQSAYYPPQQTYYPPQQPSHYPQPGIGNWPVFNPWPSREEWGTLPGCYDWRNCWGQRGIRRVQSREITRVPLT